MYRLYKKLKLVKLALRKLSSRKNKESANALEPLRNELAQLQLEIERSGGDASLITKEREIASRFSMASRSVESYAKQRSRVQWLKEGDNNSAFFFNSIKSHLNVNKILAIQDDNEEWLKDKASIADSGVNFFKQLLGTESSISYPGKQGLEEYVGPSLDDYKVKMLSAPFTALDIKEAMFSLHPNKGPGPDGFNAFFFQKTWDVMGEDIKNNELSLFQVLRASLSRIFSL